MDAAYVTYDKALSLKTFLLYIMLTHRKPQVGNTERRIPKEMESKIQIKNTVYLCETCRCVGICNAYAYGCCWSGVVDRSVGGEFRRDAEMDCVCDVRCTKAQTVVSGQSDNFGAVAVPAQGPTQTKS